MNAIPAIVTPEEAAAELLRRKQARGSLYEFFKQAWPVIEPGYDYIDGWHVGAICEHVQAVFDGEIQNLLVNMPPREGKTDLISVATPAWVWTHDPAHRFLCGGYAYALAEDASIKCRQLIRSDWYQTRWGSMFNVLLDRDRTNLFGNDRGGERFIASVDGVTLGRGCQTAIVDDPNNIKDQSDATLDQSRFWFSKILPTRFNVPKKARRIVVQQRTDERDISGYILANQKEDYVHLRLPLEFEENARCVTVILPSTKGKKWRDPRTEEGEPLCAARRDLKEIKQLKKDLGDQYTISGQLQQRPSPGEGGILKRKWFRIWTEEKTPKIDYIVQSWDTALSEKKEAAFNACTTWGIFRDAHDLPNAILLAAWRKRCEYNELREHAKRLSKNYLDDGELTSSPKPTRRALKPDMILIEDKTTGKILIRDLSRAGVTVMGFNPDRYGDKTARVRMITPTLESGHVWVPGRPPDFTRPRHFADVALTQFASFPKGASRDLVDTMTQAILRLQESGWIWRSDDANAPGSEIVHEEAGEAIY